ncbi:MAG: GIY-YIG nuclease family protein [Chlamydiales bacterium]|nr:GIY-YIG nuclease family protein [Chlamydiales bacterium]
MSCLVAVTPPHLTSSQFAVLRQDSRDSTLTKQAKSFIDDQGFVTTPISKWSSTVETVDRGQTKPVLEFITPKKDKNAIYRWKIEVLEGDERVAKRLIGKSSSVRKRLHSYFTAIRSGQGALAKLVMKSLEQQLKTKGIVVSFGVIHSRVPKELLGRVEKLLINVHKAANPEAVLNKRAGGGGASERKPLSAEDIAVVHDVASKILQQKEVLKQSLPAGDTFRIHKGRVYTKHTLTLKQKGVVYDIENRRTGMHYVGKTESSLKLRFSQHTSAINTLKRAKRLHHAIKKHPEDFVFRVLYQAPAKQAHILEEVEHAYILALGSHKKTHGYNENKGSSLIYKMATDVQDPQLLQQIERVKSIFGQLSRNRPQI